MQAIVKAADDRVWSHAGMLLEQMTADLDRHATSEARNFMPLLLISGAFFEISAKPSIKPVDEDRRARKPSQWPMTT